MEDNKELVVLATAHVTQLTSDQVGKGPWRVSANKTNEVLAALDANYTEKQIFQILDFARKYELIALNVGIDFGKEFSDAHWKEIEKKLKRVISELTAENDRLAGILEKAIGEEA